MFANPIPINLPNATISYYPHLFNTKISNNYFNTLLTQLPWQQDNITVFGKTHPQPRLTALFANNTKPYKYATITMLPHPFTETLLAIKKEVEIITKTTFTSCLANLYRNGNDSNGWHADNEKELGTHPIIASVSFGASRFFHLKHKTNTSLKQKFLLENGSLLLMKGETQHHWLHQIPKTKKKVGPRINLTFRIIK